MSDKVSEPIFLVRTSLEYLGGGYNEEQSAAQLLRCNIIQQSGKAPLLPSLISQIPFFDSMFRYTDGFIPFSLSLPVIDRISSDLLLEGCSSKKCAEIDVYGTCLSFTSILYYPNWLRVKNRIQQQSVLSVCTAPVKIDEKCIKETYNNMEKSEITKFFNKDDIIEWKKNPAKYIILDLMIERDMVGIMEFEDSYVGYSWTMTQSEIDIPDSFPYKLYRPIEFPKEKFYLYLDRLADFLKDMYGETNIIIHKGDFSLFYMRSDQIYYKGESNYNPGMTERLEEYYHYLENRLPRAYVIDVYKNYASRNFIRTSEHPAHFQPEYYETVVEKLVQYIKSTDKENFYDYD